MFAGYTTLDLRDEEQPTTTRDRHGPRAGVRRGRSRDRRSAWPRRGAELTDTLRKKLLKAGRRAGSTCCSRRAAARVAADQEHPGQGPDPQRGRGAGADLLPAPAGRRARTWRRRAQQLQRLFFNPKRYDLGRVGRYKINQRLKLKHRPEPHGPDRRRFRRDHPLPDRPARRARVHRRHRPPGQPPDPVGGRADRQPVLGRPLAHGAAGQGADEHQLRSRRRSRSTTWSTRGPCRAVIQAFFGSSQLSQFMDQTNPLAELTNKRRLSALGPGGLTRERAGFEVRDVHYSQYGRMCPIETPEGPNIGLITSPLDLRPDQRARLHRDAVPRGRRRQGHRRDPVALGQRGRGLRRRPGQRAARRRRQVPATRWCSAGRGDDYPLLPPDRIDFMDVAPEQLVSIAAALIPFLEHDDANRALMGSNMQRQCGAAPLPAGAAGGHRAGGEGGARLRRGHHRPAGRDGHPGDGRRDHRRRRRGRRARWATRRWPGCTQHDRYRVKKFWRTNQDTAINQRPLVQLGQQVEARRRSSPTARPPRTASWRSAATCWWRSCPGTATTSRTPSSSPSAW